MDLKCGLTTDQALFRLRWWDRQLEEVEPVQDEEPRPAHVGKGILWRDFKGGPPSPEAQSDSEGEVELPAPLQHSPPTTGGLRESGVRVVYTSKTKKKLVVDTFEDIESFQTQTPGLKFNYKTGTVHAYFEVTHGVEGEPFQKPHRLEFEVLDIPEMCQKRRGKAADVPFVRKEWVAETKDVLWDWAVQAYDVVVSLVREAYMLSKGLQAYPGQNYDQSQPEAPVFEGFDVETETMGTLQVKAVDMREPIMALVDRLWETTGLEGKGPRVLQEREKRAHEELVSDSGSDPDEDFLQYPELRVMEVEERKQEAAEEKKEEQALKLRRVALPEDLPDVSPEECVICMESWDKGSLRYFTECGAPHWHCYKCVHQYFKHSATGSSKVFDCTTCRVPVFREHVMTGLGEPAELPTVRTRPSTGVDYAPPSMEELLVSDDDGEDTSSDEDEGDEEYKDGEGDGEEGEAEPMEVSGVPEEVQVQHVREALVVDVPMRLGDVPAQPPPATQLEIRLDDVVCYALGGKPVQTVFAGPRRGKFPWVLDNNHGAGQGLSEDTEVAVVRGDMRYRGRVRDFQFVE